MSEELVCKTLKLKIESSKKGLRASIYFKRNMLHILVGCGIVYTL